MYNEAKKASNAKYLSKFKPVSLRVDPEEAEQIKQAADTAGESMAGYILTACRERMTGKHDSMPHDSEVATCGGVELEPEAIQAAQAAADQTGETVTEYITRAINDTAARDAQLRAIGFQQQFLKHKTDQ